MTQYVIDGIENLVTMDCMNYVCENLRPELVRWNEIKPHELQQRLKELKAKNEEKAALGYGRKQIDPSEVEAEMKMKKFNDLKKQIGGLAYQYSPFQNFDIYYNKETIRTIINCINNQTLPYDRQNRPLIRKSHLFKHFMTLIDNDINEKRSRGKKLVERTKANFRKDYKITDDVLNKFVPAEEQVKFIDELYEHFKRAVRGEREKTVSIDDRLKGFANEHVKQQRPKMDINEFSNEYRVYWMNAKRNIEQLYKIYSDEYDMLTPKSSKVVLPALAEPMMKRINKRPTFPLKQNLKQYKLHTIAPAHSFIIDLMFENNVICYLVAININTRKLFIQATNITNEQDIIDKNNQKTSKAYINALKTIMKQTTIKHLKGDGEKAFVSNDAQRFYALHGIDFVPVRRQISKYPSFMADLNMVKAIKSEPSHTSLAIIDRVIRTIRDMAFQLKIGLITPQLMAQIVNLYNDTPHSTLSKYAGFPVSPNMVDDNEELEVFIIRRIHQENLNTMSQIGYNIPTGFPVKVYNERSAMAKRRSEIEPGKWHVVSRHGALFEIEDEHGQKQIKSRFQLA